LDYVICMKPAQVLTLSEAAQDAVQDERSALGKLYLVQNYVFDQNDQVIRIGEVLQALESCE